MPELMELRAHIRYRLSRVTKDLTLGNSAEGMQWLKCVEIGEQHRQGTATETRFSLWFANVSKGGDDVMMGSLVVLTISNNMFNFYAPHLVYVPVHVPL